MTFQVTDWDGPGTGFTIVDSVAYVDTVAVLIELPVPPGLLGELRRLARRRMHVDDVTRPDRNDPRRRHIYGKMISLAQPANAELELLIERCEGRLRVYRADLAFDFHLSSAEEVENCRRYLDRHDYQKWRGKVRKRHVKDNTVYGSVRADTTRNTALYADKPSRRNGERCVHFEMRFVSAKACRRAGFGDLRTLIAGVDALAVIEHQRQLRSLDHRRFDKLTEEAGRKLKRRHRRTLENTTVDQLKRRIQGMIFAALQKKNFHPDRETTHTIPVQEIGDQVPFLRPALIKIRNWQDFMPAPQWWLR